MLAEKELHELPTRRHTQRQNQPHTQTVPSLTPHLSPFTYPQLGSDVNFRILVGQRGIQFMSPWCYTSLSHISPSLCLPFSFDIVCHYALAFCNWRLPVWLVQANGEERVYRGLWESLPSSHAAVRKHTGLINDDSHNSSLCILYPLLACCQLTLREAEVYI